MVRLSRRNIAEYAAQRLIEGDGSIVNQLAAYLVETGKTSQADLLVRDIEFYLARAGHLLAQIGSVHSLSAETKKAVIALLKKQTGARHVDIAEYHDDALVAGIKIDIPGQQLDTSVARALAPLTTVRK